ncbi:hypothetical protein POM88_040094 [Heracleum sosnowskyi]|uniref:Hexosyltransferase n=1 Tax=Heracleum sosnowskyi TaxID=360622 RepID=A0AAD8M9Z2_9APIA|nr:hypothetical protein POM88_040094 [Heracleum sosnowskyi]
MTKREGDVPDRTTESKEERHWRLALFKLSAIGAISLTPEDDVTYQLVSRVSIADQASAESKKIVGVFYKDNEYASANPSFLGCAENALGIREWLESKGHQYIVTDDKEGPDCELEKHIPDLHVLITGIGSDHIDLNAAAAAGLTVSEITGSNLFLLQKMSLKMEPEIENQIGAQFEEDLDKMLPKCDIIVINTPLTEKTKGLFDKAKISKLKKGLVRISNPFVVLISATSGGILDRAIEAEEQKHGDFLRPDHVEGYLELSTKTKIYFATAVALWDADFYVKVDDDVHVNIGGYVSCYKPSFFVAKASYLTGGVGVALFLH